MRRTPFGPWSLNLYMRPSAVCKLPQETEPCRWWISAWRAGTTSYPVLSTCLLKVLDEALIRVQQKPKPTWLVSVLRQKSGIRIFSRSTKGTQDCLKPRRKEWPSEREDSNARPNPALARFWKCSFIRTWPWSPAQTPPFLILNGGAERGRQRRHGPGTRGRRGGEEGQICESYNASPSVCYTSRAAP